MKIFHVKLSVKLIWLIWREGKRITVVHTQIHMNTLHYKLHINEKVTLFEFYVFVLIFFVVNVQTQ